jgi:hypothetical protein
MSDVYFSKDIDKIIDNMDFSKLGNNVAIKIHFGEMGCVTYLSPLLVKKVYNKIISLNKKATLIECNVLYKGSRTNKADHIKTAIAHGFDFAPIDILDGELGEEELIVPIDGIVNNAKLGKGIEKYDSIVVLTHFKGHCHAGYGGAFKNIGMGLGSRAGKLLMHADTKPHVLQDKCTGCKTCINHCNYSAISLENKNAKIDSNKCVGCAMCIAVCPHSAVDIDWDKSSADLICKKIVDYSRAVLKIIPNALYINVLQNITKDCDCFDYAQKPLMNDIGIMYSKDIVSIDHASIDLANNNSNNEFAKINTIDKNLQVDYASECKMGEKNYNLINLD